MLSLPDVRDRLLTLVGIRSGNVGLAQAFGSINIRKILMLAAWGEFLRHPFLGIGFANLGFRVKSYSTLAEGETAENTYLQILAEMGIVGLVAYLLFMAVAWRCLWRGLLECRKTPEFEPFYLGIAAGYCGFAFNCLLDTNLQDNLPWVLLPVMVFLARPPAVPERHSSAGLPS
jgi:O-antigen ligase